MPICDISPGLGVNFSYHRHMVPYRSPLDDGQIVYVMKLFARAHGISLARVSFLAAGDGKFGKRLQEGGSCTLRVAGRVLEYLSNHWLEDGIAWPASVPRPAPRSKSDHQAAA